MIVFDQPLWFLLVLLWPLGYWWQRKGKQKSTVLSLPTAQALFGPADWRVRLQQKLPWLRHIALALLIIAMARPQKNWKEEKINGDGIDIMLALDISPSMLSRDFQPDRLTVTKSVAIDFVKKRPNDRIGLVVFSAEAFTHCPLTPDKRVVQQFISEVQVGVLKDGTAIGTGLATALNQLNKSPAKSKIVVLLTDGENNVSPEKRIKAVSPKEATAAAAEMGIKVYTIAIGKDGWVEGPVNQFPDGSYAYDYRMSQINTQLLEEIARMTNAHFFRAYSPDDLVEIYDEIDRLEKSDFEITTLNRSADYFMWFVGLALMLIVVDLLLRWGVLRSVTP